MPALFPAQNSPLALIRNFADRGDKIAQTLVDIMTGTQWVSITAAAESSNAIIVTGQVNNQENLPVAAVTQLTLKCVPPLLAALADVVCATTAALPTVVASGTGVGKILTASANTALVIDGHTVVNGERVLVKNQVAGQDNGIYTQTQIGNGSSTPFILTRATDSDTAVELLRGLPVHVSSGTVNANKTFVHTTSAAITIETTPLVFTDKDGGSIGGITISTNGTLNANAGTREVWVTTDATGLFSVSVTSLLGGGHLLQIVTDNGETECDVLAFA